MNQVKSQDPAPYVVERQSTREAGDAVIADALRILEARVKIGEALHRPDAVKTYLVMRNAAEADQNVERFGVLYLDSQNRVICCETLFTGTLSQTSVYPRELVRAALRHNAAAVVLTHNHPSASVQPSRADEVLTQTLKAALSLVDVRVMDHVIVSPCGKSLSMAEEGLI